jgi:hypothetical protein
MMVSLDPLSGDPADFAIHGSGFPSQSVGPTFLSYGPMLADGDIVFEEWEVHMFGANGVLYNNQYPLGAFK